ncbi:MAG: hypothetical protein QXG52_01955 [Candidatus Caldarchaeum sp.]
MLKRFTPVLLGVMTALFLFGGIYVNEPRKSAESARAATPEIYLHVDTAAEKDPQLFVTIGTGSLLTALSIFIALSLLTRRGDSKPEEYE